MYDWDHNEEREVDVITGSCMLIPRRVFDEVGLFDTQFFVYAEESDLCKRIRNGGYKILFTPEAQIVHIGDATSRTMSTKMHLVMIESKYKYFKKHHGRSVAAAFKGMTGMHEALRLFGWSAYWLIKKDRGRQKAKEQVSRYAKGLLLLMGLTKP